MLVIHSLWRSLGGDGAWGSSRGKAHYHWATSLGNEVLARHFPGPRQEDEIQKTITAVKVRRTETIAASPWDVAVWEDKLGLYCFVLCLLIHKRKPGSITGQDLSNNVPVSSSSWVLLSWLPNHLFQNQCRELGLQLDRESWTYWKKLSDLQINMLGNLVF